MGVFDDKKYEELDWISQTTEPIDSELNEYLKSLPESIDIDFDTYLHLAKEQFSMSRISIDSIIVDCLSKRKIHLSYGQREEIMKCFEFEMTGNEIIMDFEKRAIVGGKIRVIKTKSTLDEKVLESMLGRDGIQVVANMSIPNNEALSRVNEILDLIGNCPDGMRTRSPRKKRYLLSQRLVKLFKENEWNIKDTTLANKVGFWIADYIKTGNLAALSNFCRLKVMTHKNQAIYSMEEVQ